MKLNTAIIPVAGLGTRMLPSTKVIPKEMLPLVDRPLIQIVVHECASAGINNIVLVTNRYKSVIENHFDINFELEYFLKNDIIRNCLLSEIKNIWPSDVTITYVRQGVNKGLGHAVLCARHVIGDMPFAVFLPDVIINEFYCNLCRDNFVAMLKRFLYTGCSQVLVKYVQNVVNYGIVDCGGVNIDPGTNAKIIGVVEKPDISQAPSNLSIIGRYIFLQKFGILELLALNKENTIELTDAISTLIKQEVVEAYYLKGLCYDCGDKLGYMQAFVEYAVYHNVLGKDFIIWLQKFVNC